MLKPWYKVMTPREDFRERRGAEIDATVKINLDSGIPTYKIEETRMALRDLGLSDTIESFEGKK